DLLSERQPRFSQRHGRALQRRCGKGGLGRGARVVREVLIERNMGSGERANAIDPGRREFLKDTLAATAGLTGIGVLGGCAMPFTQESADTIVTNGRIATLNPKRPTAGAIAIRGGPIAARGPPDRGRSL